MHLPSKHIIGGFRHHHRRWYISLHINHGTQLFQKCYHRAIPQLDIISPANKAYRASFPRDVEIVLERDGKAMQWAHQLTSTSKMLI